MEFGQSRLVLCYVRCANYRLFERKSGTLSGVVSAVHNVSIQPPGASLSPREVGFHLRGLSAFDL